jgi:hypothetical protein
MKNVVLVCLDSYLVFEFLLGISETFPCSLSAIQIKIIPLLIIIQLLMLCTRTLMYLEPKLLDITFYYDMFLLVKILIVFNINAHVYIFFFTCHIMVGAIAFTEFSLLPE